MRLASITSMLPKALALTVVLAVIVVAPATAVIGFCARMPCCFAEARATPTLGPANADCCTSINCYEAPVDEVTPLAKAAVSTPTMTILPANILVAQESRPHRVVENPSPPVTTSQRLSSLSTLII